MKPIPSLLVPCNLEGPLCHPARKYLRLKGLVYEENLLQISRDLTVGALPRESFKSLIHCDVAANLFTEEVHCANTILL